MGTATARSRSAHLRFGLLAALAAFLPALLGCPKSDDPAYYIERLGSDNKEVQRRAVEDLLLMQKQAMPKIEKAIRSENPNLRMGCADLLARIRRMDSLTMVGELIDDPDSAVRLRATEAVGKLSQVWKSKAVELLARAFEGSDLPVVNEAGAGLRDMEFEEATEYLLARFEAGEGVQAVYAGRLLYETEGDTKYVRPILDGLVSSRPDLRDAAQANAEALADRIVVPLVQFVRTDPAGGPARTTLEKIGESLRAELDVILDSTTARDVLMALGAIGDEPSVARLTADLCDSRLESTWRVAAARAMALAARGNPSQATAIIRELMQVVDGEQDNRIRIGAAIALCELKQQSGVKLLLDMLDKFEEDIGKAKSDEAVADLTALRIGAQEALAESGEFVAPALTARLEGSPSPTIIWAAAKTFGEIGHADAIPRLGKYLIEPKRPRKDADGRPMPDITIEEDGRLGGQGADPDWTALSAAEIAETHARLEVFEYPDYVRWTAALALGRLGGREAAAFLRQAQEAERSLVERLAANRQRSGYFKRAPVLDEFARGHENVLFYIRRALGGL
ncbi:MAG: HEAT repeat domain-containing protein [Candidatus Brocadiaceae bacterium]|nr:HEAT repeat domain-containing protein [Candidatus Brocadiaceae bacterium]